MSDSPSNGSPPPFSKRAARRMIRRAFVLAGRDRRIREDLRSARLATLWVLEDWKFSFTVEFDRGRIYCERRVARRPDLTLTWPSARVFFQQIEMGKLAEDGFEIEGRSELRRTVEPVLRTFANYLSGVMKNPYDDSGNRIA